MNLNRVFWIVPKADSTCWQQNEQGGAVWIGHPAGGCAAIFSPVGCAGAAGVLQLCRTARCVGLQCSQVGHTAFIHRQTDGGEAQDCPLEVCGTPVPTFTHGGELSWSPRDSLQAWSSRLRCASANPGDLSADLSLLGTVLQRWWKDKKDQQQSQFAPTSLEVAEILPTRHAVYCCGFHIPSDGCHLWVWSALLCLRH